MADESFHADREQTASRQATHDQGVAAQRAREYPNPYAEQPARPQREAPGPGYVAPSAKSLAEAEARDREIVGRNRMPDDTVKRPDRPDFNDPWYWGMEMDLDAGRSR